MSVTLPVVRYMGLYINGLYIIDNSEFAWLLYLFQSHSLGLLSNGLSQFFSLLYLIWSFQTSNCYDLFFSLCKPLAKYWKTTLFEPHVGHISFFFYLLSSQRPLTTLIRVTGPCLPIPDVSSLLFRLLISSRWHMKNVLERSIVFHWLLSDSWLLYINQSV